MSVTSTPNLPVNIQSSSGVIGISAVRRKLASLLDDFMLQRRHRRCHDDLDFHTIGIDNQPNLDLASASRFNVPDRNFTTAVETEPIADKDAWESAVPGDGGSRDAELCERIKTVPCDWDPASADVALHAVVGPGRDAALVVLDGLVSETQRASLLALLQGVAPPGGVAPHPPADRWDRKTSDAIGMPPSFGFRQSLLRRLQRAPPSVVLEVQSRLCLLYPEYDIKHMPELGDGPQRRTSFVANAAVHGDCFQWHVDADPMALPRDSRWLDAHGTYANGTRGKPLFVSLLVYCNERWKAEWDAETLFLNSDKGAGLIVQPRPGRAVLMHQDVLHRVSTPSLIARRPRYSLVWKLLFVPKQRPEADGGGGTLRGLETISRPEFGMPIQL